MAYYAGWGFAGRKRQVLDRQALAQAAAKAEFSMLALSDSQRMPWVDAWLAASGLQAIGRFDNGAGEAVVIVRVPPPMPAPAQAPVSASESPERGHLMGNSAE